MKDKKSLENSMPIQDAKNEQQKKKKHPIALEEEKGLAENAAAFRKDQMSHAQQRQVLEADGNDLGTPNFNLKESNRVAEGRVDLIQDKMMDREKI